ncbi:MAG: haloacid dehalogenase type II [Lyngbya sp.]|nr:haloacid dehalogenase type II [Lyngbya sp.]
MLDFNQFEALSFDCYGTLIDWENGITPVLKKIVSDHQIDCDEQQLLKFFSEYEPIAQSGKYQCYKDVLREVVQNIGERLEFEPTISELESLWKSIDTWQPFMDTIEALQALKQKYRLVVISNIDDDLFAKTAEHLQVEFDEVVTAQQVKSYKPALRNFEFTLEKIGLSPDKLLHVAESLYHDIAPAKQMGLKTVWVNRQQGKEVGATQPTAAEPDLEVPDLKTLVSLMKQ